MNPFTFGTLGFCECESTEASSKFRTFWQNVTLHSRTISHHRFSDFTFLLLLQLPENNTLVSTPFSFVGGAQKKQRNTTSRLPFWALHGSLVHYFLLQNLAKTQFFDPLSTFCEIFSFLLPPVTMLDFIRNKHSLHRPEPTEQSNKTRQYPFASLSIDN